MAAEKWWKRVAFEVYIRFSVLQFAALSIKAALDGKLGFVVVDFLFLSFYWAILDNMKAHDAPAKETP
jgi:hypothetical protein